MRKRKRWLLAIAAVLALVLSHPVYAPFIIRAGGDYLSISELRSQGEFLYDQPVRIVGKVISGSIDWDDESKVMRFALTDDKENLDVVYEGIVPDSFRPGAELIMMGTYRPNDIFEALSFGSRGSFCNFCH